MTMWASWMRGVLREGTARGISAFDAIFPPSAVIAIVTMPIFFAARKALSTFAEFPLVEMPIAMSPFFPSAWTCLLNTSSNASSFERLVRMEVSVVSAIAGRGGRSIC